LYQEAKALLEKGEVAQAERVYCRIIAAEPNNAGGYIGLGTCLITQWDLAEAERAYKRALELEPNSGMAITGLGSVAYRQGDFKLAVSYYQRVLASGAYLAEAHWGLALAYDALHDGEQALHHYESFLERAPNSNFAGQARAKIKDLRAEKEQKP
jgi:tetratricopeptide (TPR) repeat protein